MNMITIMMKEIMVILVIMMLMKKFYLIQCLWQNPKNFCSIREIQLGETCFKFHETMSSYLLYLLDAVHMEMVSWWPSLTLLLHRRSKSSSH